MVLLDSAAAAEEGDTEGKTANNHKKNGSVEEAVAEEIQIFGVDALDHAASYHKDQPTQLKSRKKEGEKRL